LTRFYFRSTLLFQKQYEERAMPRIEPLSPPYTPEQETRIAAHMRRDAKVPPLAIFRTVARHPALQDAIKPLGRFHLLPDPGRSASLALREREIVIDRVCARCGCEYIWGVHVASFAGEAGLTPEQVTATASGDAEDPAWSDRDRLLIRLVDALHDTASVSDGLWRELRARWSETQLLELLILAGWYHAISYVATGTCMELEPWAPRFPRR
jgi:4-carboxymuconolactone decarboxylase